MVRAKKNILSKCFCYRVSRSLYYFTMFVVLSPVPLQGKTGTTSDLNYVDTIQSMNGIVY